MIGPPEMSGGCGAFIIGEATMPVGAGGAEGQSAERPYLFSALLLSAILRTALAYDTHDRRPLA
jgi:hypothetical protein